MDLKTYLSGQRGRASRLARRLQVTPVMVSQWAAGKSVPAHHCPVIEHETGGLVRCEDLRADIPWEYVRKGGQPVPATAEQQGGE